MLDKNAFNKLYKSTCLEIEENFKPFENISTDLTHAGYHSSHTDDIGRPVICPISLSTTFQQPEPQVYRYDYSRGNNFTREVFEKCLATVENGKKAIAFSSGLAAINAVISLLERNDKLIMMDDVYGGTNRLIRTISKKLSFCPFHVDLSNNDEFISHMTPEVKMVWIETPTNPTMKVADIEKICVEAKKKNKDVIVVVDNTFMSPFFQRPLELGADIVVHSITKYINGHSDVVMGCAIVGDNDELISRLTFIQMAEGAVPSPFDCYLSMRGIRTLGVRMLQHWKSALTIARYFEKHPKITKVIYPGLASHPSYETQRRQTRGCPGMISIYIDGTGEDTTKFVKNLKLLSLAESLGGFESLVEIPCVMTHGSVLEEDRVKLGIHDNFVRISIGLEDALSLAEDIENALDAVFG